MNYLVIAASVVVFLLSVPLPLGVKSFFSLERKILGVQFNAVIINKSLRLNIDAYSDKRKQPEPPEGKNAKKNKLKISNPAPFLKILKRMKIKELDFSMLYGNKQNAMQTALVCTAAEGLFEKSFSLLFKEIYSYRKTVIPIYGKDECYIDIRIVFRVSFFEIISYGAGIIKSFLSDRLKRREKA